MRYFRWTHKDVRRGGERHIGRARVLLGIVARLRDLQKLRQLVRRERLGDGTLITAGIIGEIPFIRIEGDFPTVERVGQSLGFILIPRLGFPTYDWYAILMSGLAGSYGYDSCLTEYKERPPLVGTFFADKQCPVTRYMNGGDFDVVEGATFFGYKFDPPYTSAGTDFREDGVNLGDRNPDGPIDFDDAIGADAFVNDVGEDVALTRVRSQQNRARITREIDEENAGFVNWIGDSDVLSWFGPKSRYSPEYTLDLNILGPSTYYATPLHYTRTDSFGTTLFRNGTKISEVVTNDFFERIFGSVSPSGQQPPGGSEVHIAGAAVYEDTASGTSWILLLVFCWNYKAFSYSNGSYEQTENQYHLFARPYNLDENNGVLGSTELADAIADFDAASITLEQLQSIYRKWHYLGGLNVGIGAEFHLEGAFQLSAFFSQDGTKVIVSGNFLELDSGVHNYGPHSKWEVTLSFTVTFAKATAAPVVEFPELSATFSVGLLPHSAVGGTVESYDEVVAGIVSGPHAPSNKSWIVNEYITQNGEEGSVNAVLAADYVDNVLTLATITHSWDNYSQMDFAYGQGTPPPGEGPRTVRSIQGHTANVSVSVGTTIVSVASTKSKYWEASSSGPFPLDVPYSYEGTEKGLRLHFVDLRSNALAFSINTYEWATGQATTEQFYFDGRVMRELGSLSLTFNPIDETTVTSGNVNNPTFELEDEPEHDPEDLMIDFVPVYLYHPRVVLTEESVGGFGHFMQGCHPHAFGSWATDGEGTHVLTTALAPYLQVHRAIGENAYCTSEDRLFEYPDQLAAIAAGMQQVSKIIHPNGVMEDLNDYYDLAPTHTVANNAWQGLGFTGVAYVGTV